MIGLALSLNRCINASDEARALAAIRRNSGTVLRAGLIRNYFDSAGTTPATVDNPFGLVQDSVGSNNATQATTGSKPTLRRGLVNQLLYSQWGGGGTAPTGWTAWSTGGTEGALLPSGMRQRVFTSAASQPFVHQSIALAANTTYSYVVYVHENTGGITQNNVLWWGLSLPAGATFTVPTTVAANGSFVIATIAIGATAGSVNLRAGAGAQIPTTGSVTLSAPAIFTGTVTAQQILAAGGIPLTTTAPASSALGNYWWQFDPAAPGDFLQTAITTGNEGWVCAGVNFTDANVTFFSSGTTAANAGIWLYRNVGGAKSMNLAVANGSAISYSPNIIPPVNTPIVVSGGWTATTVFAGVDNTETVTTARSGASASTLPLRIGMATEGSYMLSGGMSVTVICPTLPPPADRALIRAWVAKQQGQTL